MLLNYGHTMAHALEGAALSGNVEYDLRHGEAVAVGLMFAARLARRLGRIDDRGVEMHRRVLDGYELAGEVPAGVSARLLLGFMARDKKARHDLTFVLDGPDGVEVVPRGTGAGHPGYPCRDGMRPVSGEGTADPPREGMLVLLLSGPNLDLLGIRDPSIYGEETLAEHVAAATDEAGRHGLLLEHHQTNHEGELVELVHKASGRAVAIVVNAGRVPTIRGRCTTHLPPSTEWSSSCTCPIPRTREPWRHTSVVAPVADGTVAGFGGLGYRLAVKAVAELLAAESGPVSRRERSGKGER